jgi:hypothetical protein
MDYYNYDSLCDPTRDFKYQHIRPIVEWPQQSVYQHNSYLFPDHGTPRIKQEELGGFQSYPYHQRSYDALDLPQQHTHYSPYSTILLPLYTGVSISQQSRYYPTQSMQQEVECKPHFISVAPQDSTKDPLSHALEGWDDDRQSSLSSLVEGSGLEMVDMDEMSAMIGVGDVVEDFVGIEDADEEDEWELVLQQQPGSNKRRFQSASSLDTSDEWEEVSQDSFGIKRRRFQSASSPVIPSFPVPIPVPNLTKKSRGRRVPTMSSLEDLRNAASGAGRKRQSLGGKAARMYLCEVKGCGKCFARGEHLKRHVRSIHTYEKREDLYLSVEAHILTLYCFCTYSS